MQYVTSWLRAHLHYTWGRSPGESRSRRASTEDREPGAHVCGLFLGSWFSPWRLFQNTVPCHFICQFNIRKIRMGSELRACTECGWTGYQSKLAHCHHCNTIYFECPECDGVTQIKRVYAPIQARWFKVQKIPLRTRLLKLTLHGHILA